jgi:hypothetical protein
MSVEDMGNGYFREAGTSGPGEYYGSRAAYDAKHGGSSVMEKGILGIVLIVPVLLAKFIGWVFALFSKLGIVGKILQTAFVAIAGFLICAIIIGAFEIGADLGEIMSIGVALACIILPSLWYWLWHYDAVKLMSASVFSNAIKTSFAIVFYGYILSFIIGAVGSKGFATFLMIAVTAGAFVFYFIAAKPYEQEAAKTRTPGPRPLIMLIGLGVVVALTVFFGIADAAEDAADIAKYKKENAAVFEAAKMASSKRVIAVVTKVYSDNGAPVSPVPKKIGVGDYWDSVKWVKAGDTMTITGDVIESTDGYGAFLVPVEYNGGKGYIQADYIGVK